VDDAGRVGHRVTWALVTGVLVVGRAVALSIVGLTDWSSDVQVPVAAVVAGPGAGVVLWLRMERLPEASVR
jgi:hypothetical protein